MDIKVYIDNTDIDIIPWCRARICCSLKAFALLIPYFQNELRAVSDDEHFIRYYYQLMIALSKLYAFVSYELSELNGDVRKLDIMQSVEEQYRLMQMEDALDWDMSNDCLAPLLEAGIRPDFSFRSWCQEKSSDAVEYMGRIASLIEEKGLDSGSSQWFPVLDAFLSELVPLYHFFKYECQDDSKDVYSSPLNDLFKKHGIAYFFNTRKKEECNDSHALIVRFLRKWDRAEKNAQNLKLYELEDIFSRTKGADSNAVISEMHREASALHDSFYIPAYFRKMEPYVSKLRSML